MDITNYLASGYGILFVETTEIKRAVRSVRVNEQFKILKWNIIDGLIINDTKIECDPFQVIEKIKSFEKHVIILENYDEFLNNFALIQLILNSYTLFKSNQSCIVIVGTNSKNIPIALKEFVPVLDFHLPDKNEIKTIYETISESAYNSAKELFDKGTFTQEQLNELNYDITFELIDACQGMSYEEIENILAYSAITKKSFDLLTILERKRQVIKQTGFMDFIPVMPIESLGGLDLFKDYFFNRIEPFKSNTSIKPKVRAVLIVGYQGTGKTHAIKCLCSLFNWPGIMLDIGALKGSLVGETEAKTRKATKIIDSFNNAIIGIDEIEKSFSNTGKGTSHETSEGILSHFLTWMQERKSDAIIVATANNIDLLPPELIRMGRWDAIFFVNLPNPNEIKEIITIKNKQWNSNLPIDEQFCHRLYQEKWSGAEIEQLAKDIHYEPDIESAMRQIPILAQYREKELNNLKEKMSIYRHANSPITINKIKKRKLQLH